jgi:hypothetical protein
MPRTIEIPFRRERHCQPCEHLKFENAIYGHDFVRGTYVCHHPEANEFEPLSSDPNLAAKQGKLRAKVQEHGRVISKHNDHQPSWCPLRRSRTND